MTKLSPFRYFKISPEVIRLAVMLYVRFPLLLRNVEDLQHKRGIDVSYEAVRFCWNRFGPMFAAEIRRKRIQRLRIYSNCQCYLDDGAARQGMLACLRGGNATYFYEVFKLNRTAALAEWRQLCSG